MKQSARNTLCFIATSILLINASIAAAAQTLSFLTDAQYKYLAGEISGDAAYEHLRFTTQFHKPGGGAEGLMEIAKYVERKAREYGLEDVKRIKQADDDPAWNARRAELWAVEPDVQMLASLVQTQLHLADNSRSADVTAEVIDVGGGLTDKDYEGKDVKGKLVLAWGSTSTVMNEAVWKRGAAGIIYHPDPRAIDYPTNSVSHPDQVRWIRVPLESRDGKPGTFAFGLSHRQGVSLQNLIAASKTPIKVRAFVEADLNPHDKWQVMVEGFIRGTEINDQDVLLTSHMQEEKFSANDDGSGVGSTLEIARTLMKLIREGRLPRPRRNIRFWWTTEISSERQYFADNPAEVSKILCNINQDMVGANQAQDIMRVQNVTRLPFSRWHFLNDVTEAVIEFVVRTNTQQLAEIQAGTPANPYPRPILSRLGSRHRYNAAMIPYHNNTDHMTFTEAPIGKPGITFTNWPDNYIHTSDDDLWNIDRTQLQRNAFAVAAIAFTVATAGDAQLAVIANEVYGRASVRIGEDFKVATTLLAHAPGVHRIEAHRIARNQIHQAALREAMAFDSLAVISSSAGKTIAAMKEGISKLESDYAANLDSYYRLLAGEPPPSISAEATAPGRKETGPPTGRSFTTLVALVPPKEAELSRVTPELIAGPKEFLSKRGTVKSVRGLHSLMAFEVLNFIDGRRTGLDIYNAVSAEALRAGASYYGTVTPEMVGEYLQNLASAGLVRLKQ